ncbi:MAG: phosphatase PAP2 family protein [Ignavibacteria bacterium]|nr:phosphatase PAP2 family protein [Ignavibacteria bacterium]
MSWLKAFISSLALSVLTLNVLSAQDSLAVRASLCNAIYHDIQCVADDASSFFTSPLRFKQNEWLYTVGFLGGTALLMTSDDAIHRGIGSEGRSSLNEDFWDVPTIFGSPVTAAGLAAFTYTMGLVSKDEEIRTTGRLMGESLLLAGAPVIIVKWIAGRSRPYTGDGSFRFSGFEWSDAKQSFPSGHSAMAFALSTVLAERIDNMWARVGLYGLATLTAIARAHNNQHWFSDVFVGAGLGLVSGLYVIGREHERSSWLAAEESRIIVRPTAIGVTLTIRLR